MLHGLVGGDVLDVAEPGAGAVGIPELRRLQARLLPVGPAAVRPPPRLLIAAVVDKGPPFAVGDRDAADAEGGYVDDVRGTFVVE